MKNNELVQILKYIKGHTISYLMSLILSQVLVSVCYNLVLAYIMKQVVNGIVTGNIQLIQSAFVIAGISFFIAFIF